MVKNLTASATISKNTATGTTPIILIKVEWSSGTVWYSDQTLTLGAVEAIGTLVDLSDLTAQGKIDTIGQMSSISVTLADNDGSLKTLVDEVIIEGTTITVYQHFAGNVVDDITEIMKGRVISEIVWSEGERLLKFEAETYIDEEVVGYAPAEGDIANLSPDAVNRPWPLGFGTVLKVPCVRVRRQPTGTLASSVNASHEQFQVDGGARFPQNQQVNIRVGNVLYVGSFSGNTFTVTTANAAHYTNITIAARPSNDANVSDGSVVWLANSEYIAGQYCYVDHPQQGVLVNYCSRQEGKKCFFSKPWRPNGTTGQTLLSSGHTIAETATFPRLVWGAAFYHEALSWRGNDWLSPMANAQVVGGTIIFGNSWNVSTGAAVRLVATYDDLYVFNLLPSIEIFDVFGWRTIQGEKVFSAIPSSYYTVTLSGTLGTKTCSYLTMSTPLEDRIDEGWDGSVFVSYRSTVGPNGLNVINHLLTNYTNITSDNASFDIVRPQINNYWANFVVFDQPKALSLIEEVAWQLRVAAAIRGGYMYYKYLSHVPTADVTLTDANIILKSLNIGFTRTEDVYTRIVATWHTDYSGRPEHEHIHVYERNIDKFGTNELAVSAYVYNVETLVTRSMDFWGYRLANVWRKYSLQTTIKNIELDTYDIVDYGVNSWVEKSSQDSDTQIISLLLNLSSPAGSTAEDSNYWTGDPSNPIIHNPSPTNPATGLTEVDEIYNNVPQAPGQNPPPQPPQEQYIVFTVVPSTVERATNFNVTVELQAANGSRLNLNRTALLSAAFSDGSDTLNKSTINIQNGVWSATDVQVTGGTGDDTMDLYASASGFIGDSVKDIDIIEQKTATLSWDTVPSTVVRDTAFSVALSGAGNGSVLQIDTISTHASDRLYNASGQVTSITCDALGAYAAADWYIKGGSGNDWGNFVAWSAAYADEPSAVFTISGLSPVEPGGDLDPAKDGQTLTISDSTKVYVNQNDTEGSLILTLSKTAGDNEYYTIMLEAVDANGVVDTSWDNWASLVSVDADNMPIDWLLLGVDGTITHNQGLVYMSEGVWTSAYCSLDTPETFAYPIRITASTPYPYVTLDDYADLDFPADELELTTANVDVTREAIFKVKIQGKSHGMLKENYVPTGDITVFLEIPSGSLDEVVPLTVDNTGWINGAKEVDFKIQGDTDIDTVTLELDDQEGATGSITLNLFGASIALYTPTHRGYILGNDSVEPRIDYSGSKMSGTFKVFIALWSPGGTPAGTYFIDESGWTWPYALDVLAYVTVYAVGGTTVLWRGDAALRTAGSVVNPGNQMVRGQSVSGLSDGGVYEMTIVGLQDGSISDRYLDTNAAAAGYWQSCQQDGLIAFGADALGSEQSGAFSGQYRVSDTASYISFSSYFLAGYSKFTVAEAARIGCKAIHLRLRSAIKYIDRTTTVYSNQSNLLTLRAAITSSTTGITDGSDLLALSAQAAENGLTINQKHIQAGGMSSDIEISIPATALTTLGSDTAYIWLWVTGWPIPYGEQYHTYARQLKIDITNTSLEVFYD